MNNSHLKRLRIDESFVMSPLQFLNAIGVNIPEQSSKITIHDLHHILQNGLHHACVKNVSAEKVYRGEIILIGTPSKFYPYYNAARITSYTLLKSSDNEKIKIHTKRRTKQF